MESHAPGVAGYDLGGPVSSECVDSSHHLIFTSNIHCFYWQKAPEVPMQEFAFWFENTGHQKN